MKSKRHRSPRPDNRKCVRRVGSNTVERIPTLEADALVRSGVAKYVPKRIWKEKRA